MSCNERLLLWISIGTISKRKGASWWWKRRLSIPKLDLEIGFIESDPILHRPQKTWSKCLQSMQNPVWKWKTNAISELANGVHKLPFHLNTRNKIIVLWFRTQPTSISVLNFLGKINVTNGLIPAEKGQICNYLCKVWRKAIEAMPKYIKINLWVGEHQLDCCRNRCLLHWHFQISPLSGNWRAY